MIREAVFIKRKNRFSALVEIDGSTVEAHVPNSGRMAELFIPGARVLVEWAAHPGRKTDYDLTKVYHSEIWVSIDSRLPNKLFIAAVKQRLLPEFSNCSFARKEVSWGDSRLDVLLKDNNDHEYYIELKSVTLVNDGVAKFPDAPTKRGKRHLKTLKQIVKQGQQAGVVFIVQRPDAFIFTPNHDTDPMFAETLVQAVDAGVDVYAYCCNVGIDYININEKVKIKL